MEFPTGVLTVTSAVRGAETKSVGIVTCNCVLLTTVVVSVVSLMTTTDAATNFVPVTVSTKPCCAWASVMVVADSEAMTGAGRALRHKGLSALQPGRTSRVSAIIHSGNRTEGA